METCTHVCPLSTSDSGLSFSRIMHQIRCALCCVATRKPRRSIQWSIRDSDCFLPYESREHIDPAPFRPGRSFLFSFSAGGRSVGHWRWKLGMPTPTNACVRDDTEYTDEERRETDAGRVNELVCLPTHC